MKIAMLTSVGERCGIASYTRALIKGLESLDNTTVQVVPIVEGKQPRAHYAEQAELLNANDIDVVHIQHEHSFWGGILPGKSAYWEMRYLIKKPVVLTAHTTYSLAELLKLDTEKRPFHRLAKKLLLKNQSYRDKVEIAPFITAMCLVHTSAARTAFIERGASPNYVHIVPTGIPDPLPAPTGGVGFRTKYGLQNRRVLTIFGYVAPNKGYELTLDILPLLPSDTTLVIAGGARTPNEEPYAESLRKKIAAAGLADRALITGFLSDEDVAEAMEASDIVLVPHLWATGSYSVALPLTYGKPIVASDLDCFREMAAREDCLERFPAGDRDAYLSTLTTLLDSPERQRALSEGARRYAARFSWNRVAEMTRRIYETTIGIFARGHKPHWSGTPHAHFRPEG